jgi:hypothetical protein
MDYIRMSADCIDERGYEMTKIVFITESDNRVIPKDDKISEFDFVCLLRKHWRTGPVTIEYIEKEEWKQQRDEAIRLKAGNSEQSD